MSKLFEEIESIAVLIQLKNGSAHQVLSTDEAKRIALLTLVRAGSGTLQVSNEIEPVTFTPKVTG